MKHLNKLKSRVNSYHHRVWKISKACFQKANAYLKSEHGNASAEVAVHAFVYGLSVTFGYDPVSALILNFVLMAILRMRK